MHRQIKNHKDPRGQASDIQLAGFWRLAPDSWHPFITLSRLDRPIGWWLLLLPGWWIITAFSPDLGTAFYLMILFMVGAIVMRAAGCVINDLWDRNIDKQVARTSQRPLAAGDISIFQAILFLIFLCLLGLGLLLQLPARTWLVGLAAAPLIVLYPLAKRIFGFPQLVLGLTFSWGVPTAASVLWQTLPPIEILIIYAGTVFWVIGYDTIYAIQDMKDDALTGVKSSALSLGKYLQIGVAVFYAFAILLWLIGFSRLLGPDIWLAGLVALALHFSWQIYQIDRHTPKRALQLFKSNRDAGLFLTTAFLVQQFFG